MNTHMGYFLLAVAVLLVLLAAGSGYYYKKTRKRSRETWEQLLARLAAVNSENIQQIAFDTIDDSGRPRTDDRAKDLKPEEIWRLVGGLNGLETLERNSLVLIDIAFYLQRWYPEALIAAEELRLKAREIEWHVGRLRAAPSTNELESGFANDAQNTAAAYYLMTRRLRLLFEASRLPILADVHRVI